MVLEGFKPSAHLCRFTASSRGTGPPDPRHCHAAAATIAPAVGRRAVALPSGPDGNGVQNVGLARMRWSPYQGEGVMLMAVSCSSSCHRYHWSPLLYNSHQPCHAAAHLQCLCGTGQSNNGRVRSVWSASHGRRPRGGRRPRLRRRSARGASAGSGVHRGMRAAALAWLPYGMQVCAAAGGVRLRIAVDSRLCTRGFVCRAYAWRQAGWQACCMRSRPRPRRFDRRSHRRHRPRCCAPRLRRHGNLLDVETRRHVWSAA